VPSFKHTFFNEVLAKYSIFYKIRTYNFIKGAILASSGIFTTHVLQNSYYFQEPHYYTDSQDMPAGHPKKPEHLNHLHSVIN